MNNLNDLVACWFSNQLSSPQYFHYIISFLQSRKQKKTHHETLISRRRPHPAINNDTTTSSTTKNCWVDNNTFGHGEAIAFSCCRFRIRFWVWIAVCCLVAGECLLFILLNIIAIINAILCYAIIWCLSNIHHLTSL